MIAAKSASPVLLGSLVLMGLLGLGCAAGTAGGKVASGAWQARDFTLKNLKGRRVSLSDFSDARAVILDFWALWCDSCKAELPRLDELYKKRKAQGLKLVTVNTDEASRTAEVRAYVKQRGFTFPVLLDTQSKVIRRFNPSMSLPYTVILDSNGEMTRTFEGYEPGSEKALLQEVDGLLSGGGGEAEGPLEAADRGHLQPLCPGAPPRR